MSNHEIWDTQSALPPPPPPPAKPVSKGRMVLVGVGVLMLGLFLGTTGSSTPETITATAPTVTKTVSDRVVVTETVTPDAATPEPTPEPPTADSGVIAFGKTWTWEDGMEVKVSAPKAYRTSNSGIGGEGYKHRAVFTVTITNRTGARMDPTFLSDLTSGDREGDQIFDSANDIGGGPDASLRDGKSVTFKIAYGVDDIKDIELQVSPDFNYDPAIFSTSP